MSHYHLARRRDIYGVLLSCVPVVMKVFGRVRSRRIAVRRIAVRRRVTIRGCRKGGTF